MLSNNKLLGKCWYGRYRWIQLVVECESMVEKGINFILCLGTAYDISSRKVLGTTRLFLLTGKACHPKKFISLFCFELWHLYKFVLPSAKGLSIYFMQFLFLLESPSSLIKHQLRGTMIILENWV